LLQVSTECRDLLSQILVRDPKRRLNLVGIQRHPFYTRDLPSNFFQASEQLKAAPLPTDIQVGIGLLGFFCIFDDVPCNLMAYALQSLESVDQIINEAKICHMPFVADAEDFNNIDETDEDFLDG
jgi:hypothetical protein